MTKQMLIVTKHFNIGGAEKMLLRILPTFLSLGYKIDIFLLYNSKTLLEYKTNLWLNSSQCTVSSFFPYKDERYKKIMKAKPDAVYREHINEKYDIEIAFQESYATKIISKSPNKKSIKIAWIHSNFEEYHFSAHAYKDNLEEFQTYQKFNKIVFCSYSAMHAFDCTLHNNFQCKQVIYAPISIKCCREYANQYNFCSSTPYFLVLSRLSPQKGLERLIESARILNNEGVSFKIIIVGSGELEKKLQTMILEYGLNTKVQLFSSVANPFPYFKNCIAYISPSYTESFGIAVQEAMCMSIPVIACDTPGTREVLKGGEYGEIIQPSEKALAKILKRCIYDTNFVKSLQKKSQKGGAYWDLSRRDSQEKLEMLLLPDTRIY